MPRKVKSTLILIAGIVFVVVGLFGLALPFLQGVLFLLIGIILISMRSPTVRSWIETHTRRYPRVHKLVEKVQNRITRIIGE